MLLTQKTDYALRILRSLASGECFSMQELSEKECLPADFAYKIAKKLERANMIHITRGAGGGCCLKCELNAVSLFELVMAVEDKAILTNCMAAGYDCQWKRSHDGRCRTHERLCFIQKQIEKELRSRSLAWVLDESKIV